jgi:hypothetical protein
MKALLTGAGKKLKSGNFSRKKNISPIAQSCERLTKCDARLMRVVMQILLLQPKFSTDLSLQM